VGNKGTLQKLANVEVLVPENLASFEEVIKKLNPPVNVSSPKQAGGNANKKNAKVPGSKVTGPLTHSPKATSPVNNKTTKSTSPLVFNNVVDGSSNTEGFNEMEKNIQVVTRSLTYSLTHLLTHSLTHRICPLIFGQLVRHRRLITLY